MKVVQSEIDTDTYALERARAFGRSPQELHSLLGGFGLFLAGEVDTTPIAEWIDEADIALIDNDLRIAQAQEHLYQVRKIGKPDTEHHAAELSRSTEWFVLIEKFVAVLPVADNTVTAA